MHESKQLFTNKKCIFCGENQLSQLLMIYAEPLSGDEIMIFTTSCDNCNYKKSETMPVKPSKYAKSNHYELKIKTPEDMESKIYRAPSASIEIPSLEMSLEPGIAAEFFITNVEGVLLKFKNACEFLLRDEDNKDRKKLLEQRIKTLSEYIKGNGMFNLILFDSEGYSYVQPKNEENLHYE
ncbi:MAG: ZPR1 zinc finger domain-containing protein [Candidatus Hodarchaeota archaeon]